MAINSVDMPLRNGTSDFAQPVKDILQILVNHVNQGRKVETSYIKKGALFIIGCSVFLTDSDTAITGTAGADTQAIKLTVSGTTATPSWTDDLTDVEWNNSYSGYYDTEGNYYFLGETYVNK